MGGPFQCQVRYGDAIIDLQRCLHFPEVRALRHTSSFATRKLSSKVVDTSTVMQVDLLTVTLLLTVLTVTLLLTVLTVTLLLTVLTVSLLLAVLSVTLTSNETFQLERTAKFLIFFV